MALNDFVYNNAEDEEDYIDMEVNSFYNNFRPNHSEFEFHKSRDHTSSPADELFYKGKLLPLHLPPRLQMVEKLLQNSSNKDKFDSDFYSTPLTATPTTMSTPFESCNISPTDSCKVSRELNREEYFSQYTSTTTTTTSVFIHESVKKSWMKKFKLIKQCSIGSKLKYLKSLFGKSGCSDESCAAATKVADEVSALKAAKKKPFGHIEVKIYKGDKEKIVENSNGRHRRSFSMVMKRQSTNKSSSLSSSNNSNPMMHSSKQVLKRSNSSNSEFENSIQGAIAHCKQSQHTLSA